MIIVLFGPQGSGKSTQAKRLAAKLGFVYVSTGNIFREISGSGSVLGQTLLSYMQKGELVPDDLTAKVLKTWLDEKRPYTGLILDGYPRNMAQAVTLNENLKLNAGIDLVFELRVRKHVLLERLQAQVVDDKRADGTEEAIARRLWLYAKHTNPLLKYFREHGILVYKIKGEFAKDEVQAEITRRVEQFFKKHPDKQP